MKTKFRLSSFTALLTDFSSSVFAHSGEETATGMMMSDGSWMHNGAEMMGYNMWGMGWFGFLTGLLFYGLIILGIIYLYQKVVEK